MTGLLIALLKGYKKYISPHLGHHCRFTPTCSEYAMQALEIHGLGKGLLLTIWRLLRCNPFGRWGYDPVPQKGSWKNPAARLHRPGPPKARHPAHAAQGAASGLPKTGQKPQQTQGR